MTNKHMKSHCIGSLREIQVKATMRKLFSSIKMAIIKKADNNKCWRGYGEIETLINCYGEYKVDKVKIISIQRK